MNDSSIEIIKASPKNFEDLKGLMLSALKEDPNAFSVDYEEYAMNSDGWWHNYLDSFLFGFSSVMLMILKDNIPVGMIGIIYENKNRRRHLCSIVWFYVLQKNRKEGLGKKLIEAALDNIKAHAGIIKVSLIMSETQSSALSIYKKYGFEVVGTMKKELKIDQKFIDEFVLGKFL